MEKEIIFENTRYERIPIRTHKIKFGESIISVLETYLPAIVKPGDWLAISEKLISVSQNNIRHISTVHAGMLARFIVKGVKKYPNDVGFSRPEKMQLVVEYAGVVRTFFAMSIGALGKLLGIRGVFWVLVGSRAGEIDGFNPDAMDPYKDHAVLPPKNPEKVCADIESRFNIPTTIIDGNNINVKIISMSPKMPVDKKNARLLLLDNPMGQDDEMTPFVLVRKLQE
ncbi:MAG: coenzyme F420-0:L-glutamate ligase [Patescibacteria group bacterium]|nr:coenzyme F420-0:L-glutamate ligase [Patescibacteria group bacterium]